MGYTQQDEEAMKALGITVVDDNEFAPLEQLQNIMREKEEREKLLVIHETKVKEMMFEYGRHIPRKPNKGFSLGSYKSKKT